MNILYLSHLGGESWAGPTYSVPNQITAQAKYDNVFWYNAVTGGREEWKQLPFYHDLNEYPAESIYKLPAPFNNPDLVIVECFYNMTASRFLRELSFGKIPYIIVPRGEFTARAQARKRLKKAIANFLLCRRFANRAAAIQYLTVQEQKDSTGRWNKNGIILPNGIYMPQKCKEIFAQDGLKLVSIGRIEPYQKGLDMLIDACGQIRERLIRENVSLSVCGPDNEGRVAEMKQRVHDLGLEAVITFHDGVFGKEKEQLLLQSDVFVIPSRFEGHPMALIEALSYGLPCVASTGSNMRPEIDRFNAGWTCDASVESIRDALGAMLNEKDTLKIRSEHAKELAAEYSWDVIAKKSHEAYQICKK